ncbi:MAG TPA: uL22 family ribosomal protein [Candidatus Nanoarchaeia archaeon]|nr:uL22 family ribosomal protein [Candidatus Nanoarchaeia archaeon]
MEQKNQKSDEKKQNKKQEIVKKTNEIVKADDKIMEKTESSTGKSVETPKEKSEQIKKSETQKKKIQKNEAVVNIQNAPVSTKYSRDICKFIKYKQIEKAINDLEQVLAHKKAIPMKGGVGHKKSAGSFASGSGKYPKDATEYFIKLLKSLSANATANGLENTTIVEAFANIGQKPRARFGRWKRKRTHLRLVAKELIKKQKEKKKQGEKTK